MEILSRRIRELRIDSDMKQSDMGAALGITQNMVSNYENGREPPLDIIVAYARFFNVSIEYLFGVTNEKVQPVYATDKALRDMQEAAAAHGDEPFSRVDVARLAVTFAAYYKAGAPVGSVPMACTTAFIKAMTALLDAASRKDWAALLIACNDAALAGLGTSDAMRAAIETRPETPEK